MMALNFIRSTTVHCIAFYILKCILYIMFLRPSTEVASSKNISIKQNTLLCLLKILSRQRDNLEVDGYTCTGSIIVIFIFASLLTRAGCKTNDVVS